MARQAIVQTINSVFHPLPVMRFSHFFVELILKMQQPCAVCRASQAKAVNVRTARDVLRILFATSLDPTLSPHPPLLLYRCLRLSPSFVGRVLMMLQLHVLTHVQVVLLKNVQMTSYALRAHHAATEHPFFAE